MDHAPRELRLLLLTWAGLIAGCAAAPRHARSAPQPTLSAPASARWYKLPTEPYRGKQDDIYFVNPELGFYVNGKGKIWRSQDGGQRWQLVLEKPGTYFRAIGMVDSLHGYAGNIGTEYFPGVTDTNPLYETQDGGQSWNVVANLPPSAIKGICGIDILKTKFINAGQLGERTVIHAGGRVGGPAFLLRSLDGGHSWSVLDLNPFAAMIVDVKFFDEMNGIVFAGSDAEIERSHALIIATHDGGKSWQKVYESARPFEITWKGSFPTRQVGYATIQNYDEHEHRRFVAKTTDGGKTWAELPLVEDAAVREFGIGFATPELGWVGTSTDGFETRDGGHHWRRVAFGRYVNKVRILPTGDQFTAFAIGSEVFRFGVPPKGPPPATDQAPLSVGKP